MERNLSQTPINMESVAINLSTVNRNFDQKCEETQNEDHLNNSCTSESCMQFKDDAENMSLDDQTQYKNVCAFEDIDLHVLRKETDIVVQRPPQSADECEDVHQTVLSSVASSQPRDNSANQSSPTPLGAHDPEDNGYRIVNRGDDKRCEQTGSGNSLNKLCISKNQVEDDQDTDDIPVGETLHKTVTEIDGKFQDYSGGDGKLRQTGKVVESTCAITESIQIIPEVVPESETRDKDEKCETLNEETLTDCQQSKQDQTSRVKKSGQRCVINVFISWTNDSTGESTQLKWNHLNCEICCQKLDEWKNHVMKEHEVHSMPIDKKIQDLNVKRIRKSQKRTVKCEKDKMVSIVDEHRRSLVKVNSQSKLEVKHKTRSIPRRQVNDSKINLNATKTRKTIKRSYQKRTLNKAKADSRTEQVIPKMEQNTTLPNKRKQGRPVRITQSDAQSDPDPTYLPTRHARNLRPKKPVKYGGKVYQCSREDCGQIFYKLRDRKNHEDSTHGDQMFKCSHAGCEKMFKTLRKKTVHEVTHKEIFECDYCELTFTKQLDLSYHSKTHINFKCRYESCNRTYTTKKEMLRHAKTHNATKSFPCPICFKKFICTKYVHKHMKTHRTKSHPCDLCRKSFKNSMALERHKRLHTGKGLLVCQFCGKKLNGKSSLDRHERLHTGEKPYKCNFCDKRFVCTNSQKTHEQEHTGSQFVCVHCGHKFKSKNSMIEHERIHTGENPLKCNVCDEKFRSASSLWSHEKRHSNEHIQCELCKKKFITRGSLKKHMYVHTGEKPFECRFCHKRFSNSSSRTGHIKQVHMGIKRTGHQGRAKRLKEEAKRLEESKKLEETAQQQEETSEQSKVPTSETTSPKEGKSRPSLVDQVPELARRSTGMHPVMGPLNLSCDRRVSHAPGPLPHQPPGGSSRSDFYTMVESLIQFSKEH